MSNENDKSNGPVIYHNGFRPKEESQMHAYGRELAEQRKTDYSNSHASRGREAYPQQHGGTPQRSSGPGYPQEEPKPDGFFKATLRQAANAALKNVVDPAIRNFLWDSVTNIAGSLIWGRDSKRLVSSVRTPYREISTGQSAAPRALPPARTEPRMSPEDHAWQRYEECCSTPYLDTANRIMARLYRTLRLQGKVTLAEYYHCFNERSDIADEGWGWTSIPDGSMYTVLIKGEYHVMMPKLEVLDSEIRR